MFLDLQFNVITQKNILKRKCLDFSNICNINSDEILILNSFDSYANLYNFRKDVLEVISNKALIIFDNLITICGDILLATCDFNKQIRLFSLNMSKCVSEFMKVHQSNPLKLYYFEKIDKLHCFTTGDNCIRIWNFSKGLCVNVLSGHFENTYLMNDLSDFKEGYFSCTDMSYEIKIWDYKNKTIIRSLKGTHDFIRCSLYDYFYDLNHLYISGNEENVRIFNLSTGECEKILKGHEEAISQMIFLSKRLIATLGIGSENNIKIWNFLLGICLKDIKISVGIVKKILYSNKLDLIFTYIGEKVLYIDIRNTDKKYSFTGQHSDYILDIRLSSSEDILYSVGIDQQVVKWHFYSNNK